MRSGDAYLIVDGIDSVGCRDGTAEEWREGIGVGTREPGRSGTIVLAIGVACRAEDMFVSMDAMCESACVMMLSRLEYSGMVEAISESSKPTS